MSSATSDPTSPERAGLSMPPMGMPPYDGPTSTSPPRGEPPRMHPEPELPPGGYPPGYGGPPYHAPYPPSQGSYPGSFGQGGYPPYGYPPHAPPPYAAGGYGAPPYGYGYGGFPSQQAQSRPPEKEKSRRKSPQRRKSPSRTKTTSPSKVHIKMMPEDTEVERQRATVDDTPTKVKPMRSSFHFFVDDMHETLREVAMAEVRRTSGTDEVDLFLLNTNLNERLIKAWEALKEEERQGYMVKEEQDRLRFMADDEVASRHCATLTARARSPKLLPKGSRTKEEEDEEEYDEYEEEEEHDDESQGKEQDESPEAEPEDSADEDKEGSDENAEGRKRLSPTSESPTKKLKTDEAEEE